MVKPEPKPEKKWWGVVYAWKEHSDVNFTSFKRVMKILDPYITRVDVEVYALPDEVTVMLDNEIAGAGFDLREKEYLGDEPGPQFDNVRCPACGMGNAKDKKLPEECFWCKRLV